MTRRNKINTLLFLGYAAGLYGLLFIFNGYLTSYRFDGLKTTTALIYGSFGLGVATQLIFDWHNTKYYADVLKSATYTIAALLALLMIFAFETAICVLIGGPILFLLLSVGLWVTRFLLHKIDNKSQYCMPLLIVPFLLPSLDVSQYIPSQTYSVSSEIEIMGSVEDVRNLTLDVASISDEERPWTFTHSVLRTPRPISAEVIDGVRFAKWERGVAFEEVLIDDANPNTLSWTFRFPDPALLKPLDYRVSPIGPEVFLETGGYQFTEISPTKTLVTLTTTYRLKTPMNGYLALWGKLFLDDFHMAVLHVLAIRAEANA